MCAWRGREVQRERSETRSGPGGVAGRADSAAAFGRLCRPCGCGSNPSASAAPGADPFAQGQARRAAVPWVICASAFVAFNLLYDGNPFRAVEFGFTGAAILLFLAFDQRETRGIDAIGRQAEFAPGAQALLRI